VRGAIRDSVVSVDRAITTVTLLDEDMDAFSYTAEVGPTGRMRFTERTPDDADLEVTKYVLVGELPEKCSCCDFSSNGDIGNGVLLRVLPGGEVEQLRDLFGPYSVGGTRPGHGLNLVFL